VPPGAEAPRHAQAVLIAVAETRLSAGLAPGFSSPVDDMGDPYTRTGADIDGRVAIDWGFIPRLTIKLKQY